MVSIFSLLFRVLEPLCVCGAWTQWLRRPLSTYLFYGSMILAHKSEKFTHPKMEHNWYNWLPGCTILMEFVQFQSWGGFSTDNYLYIDIYSRSFLVSIWLKCNKCSTWMLLWIHQCSGCGAPILVQPAQVVGLVRELAKEAQEVGHHTRWKGTLTRFAMKCYSKKEEHYLPCNLNQCLDGYDGIFEKAAAL